MASTPNGDGLTADQTVPIAVVGVGCRFPGSATDPQAFWSMLDKEQNAHSEFPPDRLNINGFYHPSGDRQGTFWFKSGHFVKGDLGSFDAPFFSIASNEATAIDPQQKLLLEVSYEALENAGIPKETLDFSPTGVWCGSFVKDYEQICLRDPEDSPQYAATGNGTAIMSNRISYVYNLSGPSMTIDTGCSASLVCLHQACQSLATRDTTIGIVAGAGMILTPSTMMPMTALGFLSRDGKCFAFDSRANGYGRGEGVGVIILKRLDDAIRDNDTIRAVIRGTRVNQDGKTSGITLPSKEAQVKNIKAVYNLSGLDPVDTAYVECHGTGTKAGDWREATAISEALCEGRNSDSPIVIGSVKTNIGHLEGAAGVAGVIKAVMMLEHGKIPRHLNWVAPGNPEIDFKGLNVKIPDQALSWPQKNTMRVGVNSFGFGGTNAHAIFDGASAYLSQHGLGGRHNCDEAVLQKFPHGGSAEASPHQTQVFVFSANEESGVSRVLEAQLGYLQDKTHDARSLADYAYTLLRRRSKLEWKAFVVAQSVDELISKMESKKSAKPLRSKADKLPKVGLVFCGQGAQWHAMGRELLQYSAFSKSVIKASEFIQNTLGSNFVLYDELTKDEATSQIDLPEIAQPATTVLQLALVDLLESSSVEIASVVGHSSGEIAAAYAAKAISMEDACKIAFYRGQCAASLKQSAAHLEGRMLASALSAEEAQDYIKQLQSGTAVVACHNSEGSITLSGDKTAIEQLSKDLKAAGVAQKLLPVTTAYHSPHMKIIEQKYLTAIAGIKPLLPSEELEKPTIQMYSSVTGSRVKAEKLTAEYWAKNLVSPVLFDAAMFAMLNASKPNILVEVGPAAALRLPIQQNITAGGNDGLVQSSVSLLSKGKNASLTALETMGELWARGCKLNLDWSYLSDSSLPKTLADLPKYPWNHRVSYWHESHLSKSHRFRDYPRQDLIGAPTADSTALEPRWRGFMRLSENPWLQEHQVQKTIIYPAAGMVVMAIEALKQLVDKEKEVLGFEVSHMDIHTAMLIPSSAHGVEYAVNGKLKSGNGQSTVYEFSIYSKPLDRPWVSHASGCVAIRYQKPEDTTELDIETSEYRRQYADIKGNCSEELQPRQLYEHLDVIGLNYGPLFQNIVEISKGENSCHSVVQIPDTKSKMPAKFEFPHIIHPATLDSVFQTVFAIGDDPMVPSSIQSIFISTKTPQGAGKKLVGYATAERKGLKEAVADIVMFNETHDTSVSITGLGFTAVSQLQDASFLPNHRNLCSAISWKRDVDLVEGCTIREWLELLAHKYPDVSVLQVGANPELTTVLQTLLGGAYESPSFSRLTICNDSSEASGQEVITERFASFIERRERADLQEGVYDVIISAKGEDAQTLREKLKAGGTMILTTSRWEDQVDAYKALNGAGFSRGILSLGSDAQLGQWHIASAAAQDNPVTSDFRDAAVLIPDGDMGGVKKLLMELMGALRNRQILGKLYTVSQLSTIPQGTPVISLLDADNHHPWTFKIEQNQFEIIQDLLIRGKDVLWVTKGAQYSPQSPKTAVFTGLARTIHSEDAQKAVVLLDIDPRDVKPTDSAQAIATVFNKSFDKAQRFVSEFEYVERNGRILLPRLVPMTGVNGIIEKGIASARTIEKLPTSDIATDVRLAVDALGDVDSLYFEVDTDNTPALGPSELQIHVETCGIYPQDLDTIHGNSKETTFGGDFTGIVSAIGSQVKGYKVGDHVMGVARGAAKTSVRVHESLVCHRDSSKPFTGASALAAAYHGLKNVGFVGAGDSVFVNASAGSFGQAAIVLATEFGATVYAGVASQGQAAIVHEHYGIPTDRILDTTDDNFSKTLLRLTGNKGVDFFYDPIGDHVELHLNCTADGGKLFQLANKGTRQLSVKMPSRNVGFEIFDLWSVMDKRPRLIGEILGGVSSLLTGESKPRWPAKPVTEYPAGEVSKAFHEMKWDPHHGSFTLKFTKEDSLPVSIKSFDALELRTDSTYLLIGGLGGLGRSVAELLAKNGARYIAFFSRSGDKPEDARAFLSTLRKLGVDARAYAVDICDKEALSKAVARVQSDMPKIAGAIQGAAVLRDAIFEKMTYDDWATAIRPKTVGSWNLHQALPVDMDFFLFLSSSAGVIGNRGQANYASGNAFQDALAQHRSSLGMRSVSIDLGPVIGAGMVAADEATLDILRASGFFGIRLEDVHFIIERAMSGSRVDGEAIYPQIVTCVGTGGLTIQNNIQDPYWTTTGMFAYLNRIDVAARDFDSNDAAAERDSVKSALKSAADLTEAAEIISTGLLHVLAEIKGLQPSEMDGTRSASDYAVDSLMAVNIANWIFRETGAKVSVFEILGQDTILELSEGIAKSAGFAADGEAN